MKSTQNRVPLSVVMQCLLCIGLVFFAYAFVFRGSAAFGLQDAEVDSTKTAISGTMQALLGPFPTATQPTKTASPTATATMRISATPTNTLTLTPTKTPTRVLFSATPPPRDFVPDSILQFLPTSPRTPTAFVPANNPAPATRTLQPPPTNTPRPPATNTPRPPTNTPRPTRVPPTAVPPTQVQPTDPPTEPPTEPPAPTDPPATDPPATEPPATEPPATEPPATQPPAATDPPVVP